jgi:hypothetical protein
VSPKIENSFTVDTVPPKFVSVVPADGTTLTTADVVIQGNIDDPGATVVLAGVGLAAAGTAFSFPVTLGPGLNSFSLIATDKAGNATTQPLRLTYVPVSVTITSPANGSVVDGDVVTVSGTFQGPVNTGITVNGVPGVVDGDRFLVVGVSVQAGVNLLTAKATTPDRYSATHAISVTSTGPLPISIIPSQTRGVAPLVVSFDVVNRSGKGISSIGVDYTGTGTFVPLSPGAVMQKGYVDPGAYVARFQVVDSGGATSILHVPLLVEDPSKVDHMLRGVWGSFLGVLASGDTKAASHYFTAQGTERYGPVIDALRPHLSEIISSFAPIEMSSIDGGIGEYAIKRTGQSGQSNLYFVYFLQDADGVWRLDSM